jgi:very-short-patch-repair endonuclease
VRNGVYEKGGARINKPEARALVSHIVSRLTDPEFQNREPKLSIGVVTFNAEQQRLIEDLLDAERRKTPSIELFFNDDEVEPIFVKNLESVQGDERDIMYFSITYGPDLTGTVSMNFGPMNRDGGERRLNVAITRARHELLVFSSLQPEQIDLSRTSAVGVRDLKHFMEFAERGPEAIAEAAHATTRDYDSQFEQAVAEALTGKGWQVRAQVGVSTFRIDIGIVDPDAPGRYLAGVECDGATYHRSATARDRDKLREHILRKLGWHIIRIWSTDWWIDAAGALDKVHSRLENLLEESRAERAERERKREEAEGTASIIEGQDVEGQKPDNAVTYFQPEITDPRTDFLEPPLPHVDATKVAVEAKPITEPFLAKPSFEDHTTLHQHTYNRQGLIDKVSSHGYFATYQEYEGPSFGDPRTAGVEEIAEGLCRIIEVEGPMLSKRAYDVYLRGCGIKRMGREIKRTMNKAMQTMVRRDCLVIEDEWHTGGFVHGIARIAGTPPIVLRKTGPRAFEEIPPSELLVASHLAITDSPLVKGSDGHLHAILEMFELKRLTTQTRTKLSEIIEMKFDYVTVWLKEHSIDL